MPGAASGRVSRVLGLGEYYIGSGAEEWIIFSLGSCIGLILHDRTVGLSAMAHVMLPSGSPAKPEMAARYANTVVPFLLTQMTAVGARRARMEAYVVGGARIIQSSDRYDIGQKNASRVLRDLRNNQVFRLAQDVGGRQGRTLRWDCKEGKATVYCSGYPARLLTIVPTKGGWTGGQNSSS